MARLFCAPRGMWMPFLAAWVGLVLNATVGWTSLLMLAPGAIALSNSLGAAVQVVLPLLMAQRRLEGIGGRVLTMALVRTGLARVLVAVVVAGFRVLRPSASLPMTSL